VIHGIVLQSQHQAVEAKQLLETAVALGSADPSAYYHLTLAISDLTPNDNESAYRTISAGMKLDPEDPYMHAQAGKIALAMKNFPAALSHLQEAIRLYPDMADAQPGHLYRITGEGENSGWNWPVQRLSKLFLRARRLPSMQDCCFPYASPESPRQRRRYTRSLIADTQEIARHGLACILFSWQTAVCSSEFR
jgi:tetratricopeptide (TPR) repeat protein